MNRIPAPPRSLPSGRTSLRVLVVDDEPSMRRALARLLRLSGHRVHVASGADEAMTIVAAGDVDVVVSDVEMPGRDGFAFLDALRRDAPQIAARLVFLTGRARDAGFRVRLEETGRPYLGKPVSSEVLVRAIESVVRAEGSV